MMGWRPHEVRAASLADIEDAFAGFLMAHGHDDGPDTSDEAVRDLEKLMERYPDG